MMTNTKTRSIPTFQRMVEDFNAAFGLYKATQEKFKDRVNNVCWDLKEMLLFSYKNMEPSSLLKRW